MKRDLFIKQLFVCYGYLLLGMLMCFMLSIFTTILMKHFLISILLQLCTTAIVTLLLCNYAWKDGKKEIRLVTTYGYKKASPARWWALGALTSAPLYAQLLLLCLSKLGIISELGAVYKLTAAHVMPLTAWLVRPSQEVVSSADFSWGIIAAIALIQLVIPVSMAVTHIVSYKDKVDSDLIVYGKSDKE